MARTRPVGLDPRTALVLLLLVGATVSGTGGLRYVPAALLLATVLALGERAWRRALTLPLTAVVLWAAGWVLPLWWTNPLTAILSLVCTYLIRFVAVIGIGAHLVATTSPTRLSAALRAWRVPRSLSVTPAVMLRFFPLVAGEARAVLDAMRLRGLAGPGGVLRQPVLSLERFIVPMIAASLRASEDLSASAILRGLGSRRTPSTVQPPRFGTADLAAMLLVLALAVAAVRLPAPLA
ncbi:MAG TPA: energy-coupling factor transporter transmembrane component T [Cellulomonas sp.]